MKMKWLNVCLIAGISLFYSCSSSGSKAKESIRINLNVEPSTLDPRQARDLTSVTLSRMLFEGLFRLSPQGLPEPALVEHYTVSPDGKTYTFHLKNSCWSNGRTLKAQDFLHSWQRTLDPLFLAENAFQLYVIKGAKQAKKGEIAPTQIAAEALDDQTLRVELEYPTPHFLELLSTPSFFPVPSESQKEPQKADAQTWVSNGPFLLKKWAQTNQIILQKNPKYWWDASSIILEEVEGNFLKEDTELALFEKGLLDWAGSPLSTLSLEIVEKQKDRIQKAPLCGVAFFRLNTRSPQLASIQARQAIAQVLNREKLITQLLSDTQTPAFSLLPPPLAVTKSAYFKDGKTIEAPSLFPEKTELCLIYTDTERNRRIAQESQQQLKRGLNIDIKLQVLEQKVYLSRLRSGEYDLALGSWIADYFDPLNFLEIFKEESGPNHTGWTNSLYAGWLEEAKSKSAEEKRDLFYRAEALLMEEMPIVPLFHFNMLYLKNEKLKNVVLSPMGILDFRRAYLEKESR
jgi:oligopeptide transport system substrate-binding protein